MLGTTPPATKTGIAPGIGRANGVEGPREPARASDGLLPDCAGLKHCDEVKVADVAWPESHYYLRDSDETNGLDNDC